MLVYCAKRRNADTCMFLIWLLFFRTHKCCTCSFQTFPKASKNLFFGLIPHYQIFPHSNPLTNVHNALYYLDVVVADVGTVICSLETQSSSLDTENFSVLDVN